jgi:hypothetical protein
LHGCYGRNLAAAATLAAEGSSVLPGARHETP